MSSELEAARLRYDLAVSAYRAALSAGAPDVAERRRLAQEAGALLHEQRRAHREASGQRPFILIEE